MLTSVLAAAFLAAPPSRVLSLVPIVSGQRIEDIQESRDGTRLITHDRGFAPRLWDPRSMRILRILGGQQEKVDWVRFSPDGQWIVTLSGPVAKVWDAKQARVRHEFRPPTNHLLTSAEFGSGSRLALGTNRGAVALVRLEPKASAKFVVTAHQGQVFDLEFSPNGTRLVSASGDKTANIWDADKGVPLATCTGHSAPLRWAHFSADGRRILTTALDGTARVWDPSAKPLATFAHVIGEKGVLPNTEMAAQFVGPQDREIVVCAKDGSLQLYATATAKPTGTLKGHRGAIREIRRSADGLTLATYGTDEKLFLWDAVARKTRPFERPSQLPTAGEFSPSSPVFWLGYADGSIRRHNFLTGGIETETVGAMAPMQAVRILPDRRFFEVLPGSEELFSSTRIGILRASDNPNSAAGTGEWDERPVFSPDGKRMATFTPEGQIRYWNTATMKPIARSPQGARGVAFSADSTRVVAWFSGAIAGVYDLTDPAFVPGLSGFEFNNAKEGFIDISLSQNGSLAISAGHDDDRVRVWSTETGKPTLTLAPMKDPFVRVGFGPNDAFLYALDAGKLHLFDAKTGTTLRTFAVGDSDQISGLRPLFSPDGREVALLGRFSLAVFETETGKPLYRSQTVRATVKSLGPDGRWDPIRGQLLRFSERTLELIDYRQNRVLARATLEDTITHAEFVPGTERFVTVDALDGLTGWSLDGTSLRRHGSYFTTSEGGWLARDPQGRYDADDPNQVEGASYVLEWEGGLEPIEVSQFKAQFYEPELLTRILGQSSEAGRPVPTLDGLRLYPEVKVTRGKTPLAIDISLEERDEGGIGRLTVLLNGKQVLSRKGVGFLSFDAANATQYLLPEAQLEGRGNLLTVVATNEAGDLASMPITVDIGVPAELQTPPVTLHALFVGVGDYIGTGKDLQATPNDATSLASALETVAKRLLPNRVDVTLLRSGGAAPTKANITRWFRETASKTTSSDILFVFFAGHGTAAIGTRKDYFFLTAEANPAELNEASATTSAISGEELRGYLAAIPAGKQVVILDTCHSGAASNTLIADRSVSGDYRRAWESIRDASGTWLLAGSAADQLSYESANVEHGMLTYSLLEAIDKANSDGLRPGSTDGEFFVDVEQWLTYAANRVESLKNEVGIKGIQRPELRRSASKSSFDLGVATRDDRGKIGLKPPKPVLLVGEFSQDEEDPLGIEAALRPRLGDLVGIKAWFDVARHPMAYRASGTYTTEGDTLRVRVVLARFDTQQTRKTLDTFTVEGSLRDPAPILQQIATGVRERILKFEEERGKA